MNTRYSFRVLTFRLFDDLWDREYIEKEKEKRKKKFKSVEIIVDFPYGLTFFKLIHNMFWNYVKINVEQFDLILLNIKRCLTRSIFIIANI